VGVVASREPSMNAVILQAPGNRTFIARPGDALFDAAIVEIRRDSVVFELKPLEGGRPTGERLVRPVRSTSENDR